MDDEQKVKRQQNEAYLLFLHVCERELEHISISEMGPVEFRLKTTDDS